MSTETKSVVDRLKICGLLQTKGLIGGKWTDAYDGKTFKVFAKDIDKDQVILLGARALRVENQDEIDACIAGMLPDPKEARVGITEVHFLPFNLAGKRTAITYINQSVNWHRVSKGAPEQIFQIVELCNQKNDEKNKVNLQNAVFVL